MRVQSILELWDNCVCAHITSTIIPRVRSRNHAAHVILRGNMLALCLFCCSCGRRCDSTWCGTPKEFQNVLIQPWRKFSHRSMLPARTVKVRTLRRTNARNPKMMIRRNVRSVTSPATSTLLSLCLLGHLRLSQGHHCSNCSRNSADYCASFIVMTRLCLEHFIGITMVLFPGIRFNSAI